MKSFGNSFVDMAVKYKSVDEVWRSTVRTRCEVKSVFSPNIAIAVNHKSAKSSFEVPAVVNYNQDGLFKMAADEVPERIQRYIRRAQEKKAPKPTKGGAKTKRGQKGKG